jgi:UV DNA damage endonuclease
VRLGFAVKILGDTQPTSSAGTGGGLPAHDARRWRSGPHLRWSIEALHGVHDYLARADIGMYRMASSLAPTAWTASTPASSGSPSVRGTGS